MKIKIEENKENPLLKHQDITFLVEHPRSATPPRLDIRAKLAAMLNCKEDQLYVVKLNGLYGQAKTQGFARLYPSKQTAIAQEQDYVIKRHTPKEAAPTEPAPKSPIKETEGTPIKKKEEVKAPPKAEEAKAPPKAEEAKAPPKAEEAKAPPKAEEAKGKPKKKKKS